MALQGKLASTSTIKKNYKSRSRRVTSRRSIYCLWRSDISTGCLMRFPTAEVRTLIQHDMVMFSQIVAISARFRSLWKIVRTKSGSILRPMCIVALRLQLPCGSHKSLTGLQDLAVVSLHGKKTRRLALSLPLVINFKFPLQPHQKYYITQ